MTALIMASFKSLAEDAYDVIDMGKLDDNAVFAFSVNDFDKAVGYSFTAASDGSIIAEHGFIFQNSIMSDLGAIANASADQSVIFDLNNNDQAVGYSLKTVNLLDANGDPILDASGNNTTGNFEKAAWTITGSGVFNEIPSFDDENHMRALSINNNGVIVGFGALDPDDDVDANGDPIVFALNRAFIFDTNNDAFTRVEPYNYTGQTVSIVLRDINDNGIAVGWSEEVSGDFKFRKSISLDISDPQNPVKLALSEDGRSDAPFAINNAGKVVGKWQNEATRCRFDRVDIFCHNAYIYDTLSQTVTEIPPLVDRLAPQFPTDKSIAYDINEKDQVVGTAIYDVVPDTYHAFIFENGVTKDLNKLIDCKIDPNEEAVGEQDWILYEARSINESGVIVGNGLLKGERHAFMLMPRINGAPVKACEVAEETEKSGSGSIGWLTFGFILSGLVFTRRSNKSKV
jgi:probable HAF family extracellular repeat protein